MCTNRYINTHMYVCVFSIIDTKIQIISQQERLLSLKRKISTHSCGGKH